MTLIHMQCSLQELFSAALSLRLTSLSSLKPHIASPTLPMSFLGRTLSCPTASDGDNTERRCPERSTLPHRIIYQADAESRNSLDLVAVLHMIANATIFV